MIACVGALLYDEDARLLLIKRGRQPGLGQWSLPGGRVEPGESLDAAVVREVFEETGLVVTPGRVVGEVRRPAPDDEIYAITDIAVHRVGGTLRPGDDADDARFVDGAELSQLVLTPGLLRALGEWGALPAQSGRAD